MFLIRSADAPRREAVQQELFTLMLLRDAVTSRHGDGRAAAPTSTRWW